jgi:hypothetical protein
MAMKMATVRTSLGPSQALNWEVENTTAWRSTPESLLRTPDLKMKVSYKFLMTLGLVSSKTRPIMEPSCTPTAGEPTTEIIIRTRLTVWTNMRGITRIFFPCLPSAILARAPRGVSALSPPRATQKISFLLVSRNPTGPFGWEDPPSIPDSSRPGTSTSRDPTPRTGSTRGSLVSTDTATRILIPTL